MNTPSSTKRPVKDGEHLKRHLEDYIDACVKNPLHLDLPRVPTAEGFAMHLGRDREQFLALRRKHPLAFEQCLSILRKELMAKSQNVVLAEQVAAKPLLDLNLMRIG